MRVLLPGDGWVRVGAIAAGLATMGLAEPFAGIWATLLGALTYFLVRSVARFLRERAFLQAEIRRMERNIPSDL